MAVVRTNPPNFIFLCLVFVLQSTVVHSKLSDYATPCSVKDPKFNECFKESATHALGEMMNGIPELGVPPIDPFHIPKASFEEPDIGVVLSVSNSTVYNLAKTAVTDVSAEPEKFTFRLVLHTRKEIIAGDYRIKGKIFIMPIHGVGEINVVLTDVTTTLHFSGEPTVSNGELYMKLTNLSVSIEPQDAKVHLDNLFNGNEMLGTIMNKVLNSSWQELFGYLKPKLEHIYEGEIFSVLRDFFLRVPYNQLFLDFRIQ